MLRLTGGLRVGVLRCLAGCVLPGPSRPRLILLSMGWLRVVLLVLRSMLIPLSVRLMWPGGSPIHIVAMLIILLRFLIDVGVWLLVVLVVLLFWILLLLSRKTRIYGVSRSRRHLASSLNDQVATYTGQD